MRVTTTFNLPLWLTKYFCIQQSKGGREKHPGNVTRHNIIKTSCYDVISPIRTLSYQIKRKGERLKRALSYSECNYKMQSQWLFLVQALWYFWSFTLFQFLVEVGSNHYNVLGVFLSAQPDALLEGQMGVPHRSNKYTLPTVSIFCISCTLKRGCFLNSIQLIFHNVIYFLFMMVNKIWT